MNDRIKAIRNHFELSQSDFGKKLGITGAAISRIESGARGASNQIMISICREFNVSEAWLKNGEGEMFFEMSKADLAASLVASKIKTDNQFILDAFIALGQMSDDEWTAVETFVKKLKNKK